MEASMSVDSLVAALKGLQREKSCLQDKLQQNRSKKQTLQKQLKETQSKHNQIKETNIKMKETLNVAQAMLEKSSKDQESVQVEIDTKRKSMDSLNAKIEEEKRNHRLKTTELQTRLADLSKKFIAARKFYDDENLTEAIAALQAKMMQLKTDKQATTNCVDELEKKLEQLCVSEDAGKDEVISVETQDMLLAEQRQSNTEAERRIAVLTQSIEERNKQIALIEAK